MSKAALGSLVAQTKLIHAVSERHDPVGGLDPDLERKRSIELIPPAPDTSVHEVDAEPRAGLGPTQRQAGR
jgi:hypothetical protein